MIESVSHIALIVPDLQKAEHFYKNIFDMELIGREVRKDGEIWFTLPFDKDWEDSKATEMELDMIALRKGGFMLALFRGDNPPGQVFAIGLSATRDAIKRIHEKLPPEIKIDVYQADRLEFIDPFNITWQIAIDPVFRTAGEFANRWLAI
jgi:catechol 2,3-dioxygenase-like lactoylglutathione lyase family enzyme